MKRLLTCLLLSLALSSQAQTEPLLTRADKATNAAVEPVTRFTLANGMEVIIRPERRAPTVVHMVWVRAGPVDEVDGTSGVAHVLEHMMFKGTASVALGCRTRGPRERLYLARLHRLLPAGTGGAFARCDGARGRPFCEKPVGR